MKKLVLVALALILALGSLGVGYALWSDTLYINGNVQTGEVDWEFLWPPAVPGLPARPPSVDMSDTGLDPWVLPDTSPRKDVGSTTWEYKDKDSDGDFETLELTINNGYPYYTNHLATWVHCNGSVPIHIEKVHFLVNGVVVQTLTSNAGVLMDLSGDGQDDIYIVWGDNFGAQLHYCEFADISFDITILQPAPQNATLTFEIQMQANQWNESMWPPQ